MLKSEQGKKLKTIEMVNKNPRAFFLPALFVFEK